MRRWLGVPEYQLGSDFWKYWVGETGSAFGDAVALVVVPLLVLKLTGSVFLVGLIATPRTIGYLLVGSIAGTVTDRHDPRRLAILADSFSGTIFAIVAVLWWLGHLAVWELAVVTFVSASADVVSETSVTLLVKVSVTSEYLVRANAYLSSASQLSTVIGPVTGGVLVASGHYGLGLLIQALSFVASAGALRWVHQVSLSPRGPSVRFMTATKEGFRFVWTNRLLRNVVVLQALVNFALGVEPLVIYFAKETLRLSPSLVGLVVAATAVGGVVGGMLASRQPTTWRTSSAMVGSLLVLSAAWLGMGLASNAATCVIAEFLVGASSLYCTVNIRALRQRLTPSELIGRVTSTARTLALASSPLGVVVAGAWAGSHHGQLRMAFAGTAVVIAAVASIWLGRRAAWDPMGTDA